MFKLNLEFEMNYVELIQLEKDKSHCCSGLGPWGTWPRRLGFGLAHSGLSAQNRNRGNPPSSFRVAPHWRFRPAGGELPGKVVPGSYPRTYGAY
jgi:hypothetical protein